MKRNTLVCAALLALAPSLPAASILRITEVMSNGDIRDWFEVTNFGDSAATLVNPMMDDSSEDIGVAVALNGITTIAPGESVVFIEHTSGGDVDTFKTNWSLSSTQVGYYGGSGVGLSASGDGVTFFDDGNLVQSVAFGTATSGTSFQWNYDSAGNLLGGPGLTTSGTTWVNDTTTMLGTPGAIPEPSALLLSGLGALAFLRRRRA